VISQFYVINLDRELTRWSRVKQELRPIRDSAKDDKFQAYTAKVSAEAARYFIATYAHALLGE
jgi:hypothetical protein